MSILIESDPQPKSPADAPDLIVWPVKDQRHCPPLVPPPEAPFSTILEARRSERAMPQATIREIVNALAFAMRPRLVRENDIHRRTKRPSVSAGALHPVEVVIADWRGSPRLMRYNPMVHCLELLWIAQPDRLHQFAGVCAAILPEAPQTALALIGDVRRVEAVYENPHSLLWRDAGALIQILGMVSTAYRLGFCPLGVLGGEVVEALGLDRRTAQPLGCAVIGRRASDFAAGL